MLLLEEDANEAVYAGDGVCGRFIIVGHFTVFLLLEHPAETMEGTPEEQSGFLGGGRTKAAIRLFEWRWAFTYFLHDCFSSIKVYM